MNNEFLIFDIWEKIFTEDDAWVGVILVNGGYRDAPNGIHDVWNVTLIKNVLFIRSVEKLKVRRQWKLIDLKCLIMSLAKTKDDSTCLPSLGVDFRWCILGMYVL
ncbi:hypothetical protein Tco_1056145 [Tanacetum coccineum]|uniref:Uncharacterized protein n=1 Tax=Tanacetum coccineum TaxID=301880 RepID=A0ABQ5H430_9ASTR